MFCSEISGQRLQLIINRLGVFETNLFHNTVMNGRTTKSAVNRKVGVSFLM